MSTNPYAPPPGTGPGNDRHDSDPDPYAGWSQDPAEVLARIAGGRGAAGTGALGHEPGRRRVQARTLGQLAYALSASARKAGSLAVTSGRWLADVIVDAAPRIPVRDLETLRRQHPGLETEALADVVVAGATRATTAVGVGGGALTGLKWSVPVTLVTIPIQLAVEVAAVAAIEIKLVAELHEIYGAGVQGTTSQRGTAYALSWANRRGINPLEPASMTAAIGVVARRRVQRRLVVRAGRGIGSLAPLMAGAVYGAFSNRRQTLRLADSLRGDLRRHPRALALTNDMTGRLAHLAVERLIAPGSQGRRGLRRRGRPAGP